MSVRVTWASTCEEREDTSPIFIVEKMLDEETQCNTRCYVGDQGEEEELWPGIFNAKQADHWPHRGCCHHAELYDQQPHRSP